MTTITLDVPDGLAKQLLQRREQLPRLLAMTLELFPTEPPGALSVSYPSHPVCEEMLAFLASGPSPERIVAFKISSATQRRLGALLDKNREEGLTPEETAELDVYTQVHHLLLLLKARARLAASAPA